jgi:uncharacterized protein
MPDNIMIMSDGKAGDLAQLLGVAEASGLPHAVIPLRPRPFFTLGMPWFGIDPDHAPGRPGSPFDRPYPAIAMASGRRMATYLRRLKALSPATFAVFLKDPKAPRGAFDFIWMPDHDMPRAANIFTTPTSPHRLHAGMLEAARREPDARLDALSAPRIAVLVGGDTKNTRFSGGDGERFCAGLDRLAQDGGSLMISASRRTPDTLTAMLATRFGGSDRHFLWDGSGSNPYAGMLARADAVVVTADSINMLGEAAVTGRPIHVFRPSVVAAKTGRFITALSRQATVIGLGERLDGPHYPPVNATPLIATELLRRYEMFRQTAGPLR